MKNVNTHTRKVIVLHPWKAVIFALIRGLPRRNNDMRATRQNTTAKTSSHLLPESSNCASVAIGLHSRTLRMSRDEQRANGVELKPLADRAARHPLDPFVRLRIHREIVFPSRK